MSPTTTAGAAAAAAAIANAIKASGTLVRVEPEELRRILERQEAPLVVTSKGGFFVEKHQYLTSYRGLAFYASSRQPIELPGTAEVIAARSMWMPS